MLLVVTLLLVGASVVLIGMAVIPRIEEKRKVWQVKEAQVLEKKLDNMFEHKKTPQDIIRLYYILPPVLGFACWILLRSQIFAAIGAVVGLSIPNFILKSREAGRRKKFNVQLLDAMMLISSALKGGLSMLQALEVVVEEMPPPISQEFGLVVRENKMGVSLEESIKNLNKRMNNIEELTLVTNSILVARETGGDLIKVLSRLALTIRDNRKLKENVKTLTMQGRLQGMIMMALPFLFTGWVLTNNRHHFDFMLSTDIGKVLLVVAIVLQIVGTFLINKFSKVSI